METLLQQLWNEYKLTIDAINKATDDEELSEKLQKLNSSIDDTEEMRLLRKKLVDAGVTL